MPLQSHSTLESYRNISPSIGGETQEECDAAFKRFSREEAKRERQFERELSKYLRGEPNKLEPGTNGMRKAGLLPENKRQLRKEIASVEIADSEIPRETYHARLIKHL